MYITQCHDIKFVLYDLTNNYSTYITGAIDNYYNEVKWCVHVVTMVLFRLKHHISLSYHILVCMPSHFSSMEQMLNVKY